MVNSVFTFIIDVAGSGGIYILIQLHLDMLGDISVRLYIIYVQLYIYIYIHMYIISNVNKSQPGDHRAAFGLLPVSASWPEE